MKNIKNLTLIFILLAIISLSFAIYFLISHFSPPSPDVTQVPTNSVSLSPTVIPTQPSDQSCKQNQLTTKVTSQGAAGNIYDTLTITNTGIPCEVILGNSITVAAGATNIVFHNQETITSENYLLATGAKVYSQLHYPNGPQCQSGISQQQITVLYKTGNITVPFTPDSETGKLRIQACSSPQEKTTVDIWPLSKNPITP